MRLEEIQNKGLENEKIVTMIKNNPTVCMNDIFENKEKYNGKIICFMENYQGFETDGVVIRTVEPVIQNKYFVYDLDLSDGFKEEYEHRFSKAELKLHFVHMCKIAGFVLEK